jgi:hypothetical protein
MACVPWCREHHHGHGYCAHHRHLARVPTGPRQWLKEQQQQQLEHDLLMVRARAAARVVAGVYPQLIAILAQLEEER